MPHREMTTGRLEAFSDGVIAVIVTIMVLEMHAPAQPTLAALWKVAPVFISYGLSFLIIAIMWVNHHHMIHVVHKVTARLLWSNLNLLFWMSLVPFVTDFVGKNYREPMAVALYGLDLTLCSAAFYLLRIRAGAAGSGQPGNGGIPPQGAAQECNLFPALSEFGSPRLRLYLRFVLRLYIDPGAVLPARKKTGRHQGLTPARVP